MPTLTPITTPRLPPTTATPADASEPRPPAAGPKGSPAPTATPGQRTPGADDSVEDWYFCGEGSLYR